MLEFIGFMAVVLIIWTVLVLAIYGAVKLCHEDKSKCSDVGETQKEGE